MSGPPPPMAAPAMAAGPVKKLDPPLAVAPRTVPVNQGRTGIAPGGSWVAVAVSGETLCTIAQTRGFADCAPLRKFPENQQLLGKPLIAGDSVFVPDFTEGSATVQAGTTSTYKLKNAPWALPTIRIIRGPAAGIAEPAELNISNYEIDKSGPMGNDAFPRDSVGGFDPLGDADEDAFKVEVTDPNAKKLGGSVALVPLMPLYEGNPRQLRAADPHGDFSPEEVKKRCLRDVKLHADPGNPQLSRTCYLRLVPDSLSKSARGTQGVIVTDGFPADPDVEILDQDIAAYYAFAQCPGAPGYQCGVVKTVPLHRGRTVQVKARVVRPAAACTGNTATGAAGDPDGGVTSRANVVKQFKTHVRRHWAQAHLRFDLRSVETVDAPSDMFTIGDWLDFARPEDPEDNSASGVTSAGAAPQPRFRLNVQGFGAVVPPPQQLTVTVTAGDAPAATAASLAAAINALPGLQATLSPNPTALNRTHPSVDVLLSCPAHPGARITIVELSGLDAQDSRQKIRPVAADLNAMAFPAEPAYRYMYHVGMAEHRLLVKSLGSGAPLVIDLIVVANMNCYGYAIGRLKDLPLHAQPVDAMKNSAIVVQGAVEGAQEYLVSHELGHLLTDLPTHSTRPEQLMEANPGSGKKRKIFGTLLGANPPDVNWEDFQLLQNATVYRTGPGPTDPAVAIVQGGQVFSAYELAAQVPDPVTGLFSVTNPRDQTPVGIKQQPDGTITRVDDSPFVANRGDVFHDPANRRLNAVHRIHQTSADMMP